VVVEIDGRRLNYWLNARKVTLPVLATRTQTDSGTFASIVNGGRGEVDDVTAKNVAGALSVRIGDLMSDTTELPRVIYSSAADIARTRRPITRDGIHFYNYYTLPVPPSRIGPVLLDILCPQDRVPALNNGHLEPAITVNLGPGDINGRWGQSLSPETWAPIRANRREDAWVVGDSYVEPSYCPHSYGLASDTPALLLSYTAPSRLSSHLEEQNRWTDDQAALFRSHYGKERVASAAILEAQMLRRGVDVRWLSMTSGIEERQLEGYLNGSGALLTTSQLEQVARSLNVDHRILLQPMPGRDPVGKTSLSYERSIETARAFRSYQVASMAASPLHSDLSGIFISVTGSSREAPALDLLDDCDSHYLVTAGALVFSWKEDGVVQQRAIAKGDAIWMGPFVPHGFGGRGALLKLNNGDGGTYQDQMEISVAWNLQHTLERSRGDFQNWGYDHGSGGK